MLSSKKYNFRKLKKVVNPPPQPPPSDSSEESDSEYQPPASPSSTSSSDSFSLESSSSQEKQKSKSKKLSKKEIRQRIAEIFPSKFSKERAKATPPSESEEEEEEDEDDVWETAESSSEEDEKEERDPLSRKRSKPSSAASSLNLKTKLSKRKKERLSESEETESDYESEETASTSSSYGSKKGAEKINIVVNVINNDEYGDEMYDEDDTESLVEDNTEELNSDDEQTFMKETYDKKEPIENALTVEKRKESEEQIVIPESIEEEYKEMIDLKEMLKEQLKQRPKNKILQRSLDDCNRSIKKMIRKARHANANAYYKLVNTDRRQTNEIDYFKHRLSNKEQQTVMTDLKEINKHIYVEKPYRLALLQSKIPTKFKTVAMQRLNMLKSMDPTNNEYYKIKNWVDAFMRIPFGMYRNINISINDGIDVCDQFMENAKKTLDNCVYGLNDAKLQIMQMLGQWIVNPNSVGTAIAIHGPPGTGKTSIVKEGISRILGREFAFIALGGCGDGSFLEGHSYTYEGSMWGKIAQILMDSKCMNPIIYFDELDKVSDTPRGQEIIGILTHLTDTSQNAEFHDKYFSEVSLDLSKCLFIFSYNDESLVNPILKDRMYRIQTKGYDTSDKIHIARDHLLPKIREQVSFSEEDVIIPDETLKYIITTPHLSKGESGVRNLKRCLEIIYTKLNLYRLVKPGNPLFEKDLGLKVEFPIKITRKEVDVFIKNTDTVNPSILAMYT